MRVRFPACAAAAAAGLFLLWGLIVFLGLLSLNAGTMERMMTHYRLPQSDEKLPADPGLVSSDLITGLYSGRFPVGTVDRPAFSEKELQHLTDCAHLVRGLRLSGIAAFCLGFAGCGALLCFDRAALFKGFFIASLTVLSVMFILLVWGLISFDSLFLMFHRLFFSNQLWLLDPRKDLLIQLMPIAFFENYALRLLGCLIPAPCLCVLYCALYPGVRRHMHGIS